MKWWKNLSSPWGWFPWLFGIFRDGLATAVASQVMEVEKVIELLGKPTPNTEDLFHALHVENQTQRSRNSHRFLSPKKKKTLLLLRRRISIINRWNVAFPAEALELLRFQLTARPWADMHLLGPIEMDFKWSCFPNGRSSVVLFGRFVLEVQGLLLLKSWDFTTQMKELLLCEYERRLSNHPLGRWMS